MQPLTAVVLGATGLIGEQVVQQLLQDAAFSKVRILVRRPVELSHPKLQMEVVNFDDPAEFKSKLGTSNCIFCCIGTTNKKVKGDDVAYRQVDFGIPVNAAKMAKDAGFTSYLLVSAVGANADSRNFYLKLKGDVETAIEAIGFQSFHTFRPGILFGKRKEFRLGETVGRVVMQALSIVLIGGLKKYKGIQGVDVAKAMVAAAKSGEKGMVVHYYEDMIKAARGKQ